MVERKPTIPNCFDIAIRELGLTQSQRDEAADYGRIMLLTGLAFMDNPDNKDKELTLDEMKVYAEEKYPNGWELFEKILRKADELERLQINT